MSPLWRDELIVRLAPRELRFTRMRRGLRPTCIDESMRTFESTPLDWRSALLVLSAYLGESLWSGTNVRVIVSNVWIRYAIVPWSDSLTDDDERMSHARLCLVAAYGPTGEDWRVSLSEGAPGETRIACALSENLLAGLRSTLDLHRAHLVSVQPALIAAYNLWRLRLPEGAGWFVSLEENALAAARFVANGWDRVYSVRIGSDLVNEVRRLCLITRPATGNASDSRVYVDAPMRLRRVLSDNEPNFEWLHDADVADATRLTT